MNPLALPSNLIRGPHLWQISREGGGASDPGPTSGSSLAYQSTLIRYTNFAFCWLVFFNFRIRQNENQNSKIWKEFLKKKHKLINQYII